MQFGLLSLTSNEKSSSCAVACALPQRVFALAVEPRPALIEICRRA